MALTFRGLFCCFPFLDLAVNNAQFMAGQWVAAFTPVGGNYITIDAYTTLGTDVDWNVNPPGVGNVNPNNDEQFRIPLSFVNSVQPFGNVITVSATAAGIVRQVDIIVQPLMQGLAVVPNHYAFQDAAGWYALDLSGIPGIGGGAAANMSCNLQVQTAPPTAAAYSHVQWNHNVLAGAPLPAMVALPDPQRGIPLDAVRNVQVTVDIQNALTANPQQLTLRVLNPAVNANLANGLGIGLQRFAFAGGGHFAVTQESAVYFNIPYSANWSNGVPPATPQGYAANGNMTLNNVLVQVTAPPGANTAFDIRGSAYFTHANGNLTVLQQQANFTINAGTALGSQHNVGNLNFGNVPNEVMRNDPLLIFWEVRDAPGGAWMPLRVTANAVYVTAQTPVATTDPDLNFLVGSVYTYHSLLDMSCRAANGQAGGAGNVNGVRDAVYGLFNPASPNGNVQRLNPPAGPPTPLQYWNGPMAGQPAQSLNRIDPMHPNLFTEPNGNIACGVWANMLIAMWAMHGIGSGRFIGVWSSKPGLAAIGLPAFPMGFPNLPNIVANTRFLVRNWDYSNHPALNNANYTHTIIPALPFAPASNEAVSMHGAAGQNNPNPPAEFINHFIVRDGALGDFYDPSYGTPPGNKPAWVDRSLAGLRNDAAIPSVAGFVQANGALPSGIQTNPDAVAFFDFVAGAWIP